MSQSKYAAACVATNGNDNFQCLSTNESSLRQRYAVMLNSYLFQIEYPSFVVKI